MIIYRLSVWHTRTPATATSAPSMSCFMSWPSPAHAAAAAANSTTARQPNNNTHGADDLIQSLVALFHASLRCSYLTDTTGSLIVCARAISSGAPTHGFLVPLLVLSAANATQGAPHSPALAMSALGLLYDLVCAVGGPDFFERLEEHRGSPKEKAVTWLLSSLLCQAHADPIAESILGHGPRRAPFSPSAELILSHRLYQLESVSVLPLTAITHNPMVAMDIETILLHDNHVLVSHTSAHQTRLVVGFWHALMRDPGCEAGQHLLDCAPCCSDPSRVCYRFALYLPTPFTLTVHTLGKWTLLAVTSLPLTSSGDPTCPDTLVSSVVTCPATIHALHDLESIARTQFPHFDPFSTGPILAIQTSPWSGSGDVGPAMAEIPPGFKPNGQKGLSGSYGWDFANFVRLAKGKPTKASAGDMVAGCRSTSITVDGGNASASFSSSALNVGGDLDADRAPDRFGRVAAARICPTAGAPDPLVAMSLLSPSQGLALCSHPSSASGNQDWDHFVAQKRQVHAVAGSPLVTSCHWPQPVLASSTSNNKPKGDEPGVWIHWYFFQFSTISKE
ncbi:hypothetical protein BC828DRAFT_86432 [Blastocladiella britannica]|nr:hypothetical protein BC828DRAFT_86432 [Blastocladiella britannica]